MDAQAIRERSIVDSRTRARDGTKAARLNIRVTEAEKALVEQAARVTHASASQFVVQAAVRAAEDALADRTRFTLPAEEWAAFTAMLDRPAKVLPALREAAGKRRPFGEP